MTRQRFDVAVVGAGPAGSTAALELAKRGVRVALLEKERLPRYKTCGGGLVGRVIDSLPERVSSCFHRSFRSVDLVFHDTNLRFTAQRDRPIVSMVMRDEFDACLCSCAVGAGAVVLDSCRVTGASRRDGRVQLTTTAGSVDAGFVVAADGATGITSRLAGWPVPRTAIPALEWEVDVGADAFARLSGRVRFDFGLVRHGYAWVFPKRDHLSIGVLSTRRGTRDLHLLLEQYMRRLGIDEHASVEKHGYVIPIRHVRGSLVRGKTVVVGDAAGFADPVTAEGISFAVLSSTLAARAIVSGDFDQSRVERRYKALIREPILRELARARVLARVLYELPRVRSRLFRQCGNELTNAMTEIIAGRSTYRQALSSPTNFFRLFRRMFGY